MLTQTCIPEVFCSIFSPKFVPNYLVVYAQKIILDSATHSWPDVKFFMCFCYVTSLKVFAIWLLGGLKRTFVFIATQGSWNWQE